MATDDAQRWNRNTHYHPLLLALAPAENALDVGCGGGLLSRQLSASCAQVTGIDPDEPSIARARAQTSQTNVTFQLGDVLSAPLDPGSFDLVVSVAAIHHFDAQDGLNRFAELLKPKGRLGVIGIGRPNYPQEIARMSLAWVATQALKIVTRTKEWQHSAPIVWPPPLTEKQMAAVSQRVLPGSEFKRRLHGRYSLTWTKP